MATKSNGNYLEGMLESIDNVKTKVNNRIIATTRLNNSLRCVFVKHKRAVNENTKPKMYKTIFASTKV